MSVPLRTVPDDFALFAIIESIEALRKRYKASPITMKRWLRLTGVVRERMHVGPPINPPPADFAEFAAVECRAQLMVRYGVAHKRLSAWINEVGATPPLWKAEPGKPRARKPSKNFGYRPGQLPPVQERRAVTSIFEEARDFLATDQRCPIYRCDFPNGTPNPTGHYWRMGAVVLTPADLLERARSKGFGKPFRLAA